MRAVPVDSRRRRLHTDLSDYWLLAVEQVVPKLEPMNETAMMLEAAAAYDDLPLDQDTDLDTDDILQPDDDEAFMPDGGSLLPILISMHSGLWRLCIITDPPGQLACRHPSLFMIYSLRAVQ